MAVICGYVASHAWSTARSSEVTLKLVRTATKQPSPLFALQQCSCDWVPRFADSVCYCLIRVPLLSFLDTANLQNFVGFMARSPTCLTKLGKPRVLMAVKRIPLCSHLWRRVKTNCGTRTYQTAWQNQVLVSRHKVRHDTG